MLAIASLTLREAVRRRVVAAAAVLAFAIVALTGWGFWRLHATLVEHGRDAAVVAGTFSVLVITLAYMFSVALAIGSALLAAPAIAGDVESGLLLAIMPRPVRRAEIVLGKWLGLATLVAAFVFAVGGAELAVVGALSGYVPPHPVAALAFLTAQALAMLTLALALSTRFAPVACGIVAIALFGLAWISGVAVTVASALGNAGLVHAGTAMSLLMPTDGLWRSALAALEPAVLVVTAATPAGSRLLGPFAGSAPPLAFTAWSAGWVCLVLLAGIASFRSREV